MEFYKTHFGNSLFNQKSKKKEFEFSKIESDIDENISTPQNNSEINNDVFDLNTMLKTIIKNENAPVSIWNKEKKEDLSTSTGKKTFKMENNLSISVKNDLLILVEIDDLQAKNDLQNPMKTDENWTNDLISQTPSEPAVEWSSRRGRKSKKMFFIAANSRFCRKKRAYDSKTFDKKNTNCQ